MNIDRWLALAGLIVAILGILLAFYFYRRTIRTKLLAIGSTESVPLIVSLDEQDDVACRSFILLWNRGSSPIEATDFVSPIRLRNSSALCVYEKDATADVTVDTTSGAISVRLLRPSEGAILMVDTVGGTGP